MGGGGVGGVGAGIAAGWGGLGGRWEIAGDWGPAAVIENSALVLLKMSCVYPPPACAVEVGCGVAPGERGVGGGGGAGGPVRSVSLGAGGVLSAGPWCTAG